VLFNQGDWIAIKLLIDRKGTPSIRGRIVGVREFRPYLPAAYTGLERWISMIVAFVVLILYLSGLSAIPLRELPDWVGAAAVLGVPISFFVTYFVAEGFVDRRVRRRRDAFYVNI
jgi:hypothetical protein